jgi:hypothetical protein
LKGRGKRNEERRRRGVATNSWSRLNWANSYEFRASNFVSAVKKPKQKTGTNTRCKRGKKDLRFQDICLVVVASNQIYHSFIQSFYSFIPRKARLYGHVCEWFNHRLIGSDRCVHQNNYRKQACKLNYKQGLGKTTYKALLHARSSAIGWWWLWWLLLLL